MDDLLWWLGVIAFWGACAFAGYKMFEPLGKGKDGALLGGILGPIGLVVAWVIRDNELRDVASQAGRHGGTSKKSASKPVDEIDALERLGKLREAGHLSDEEFAIKKRQLLAGGERGSALKTPRRRWDQE
jgi:hypothetical protein